MARLAAKEKILFYPTPLEIVDTIATNITPGQGGSILDPCAGTGEPLSRLGEKLGLITYGNELHPQRYEQAKGRLDYCLNGAREFLQVAGRFTVVFNNPPYDQELGGQRMEVTHIQADLELLTPGGLGVWIVPEPIIDFEVCHLLVTHLKRVAIRRFPRPGYDRFRQVVIFGLKRHDTTTSTYTWATELERVVSVGLPVLQANEFAYELIHDQEIITTFEVQFPQAATVMAEVETAGVQTLETWQTLFSAGAGFNAFQPVLRLSSGHTAMTIAAGIVNGTKVTIDHQPHLIKGSTGKHLSTTTDVIQTDDGSEKTVREREVLVQTITALNLVNGTVGEYNSLDNHQGFADFLLAHQQALVASIEANFPPLFEPERDMPTWLPVLERVRAPGKLAGRLVPEGLLPAQQVRAAALAARLQTEKSVILVGEMGTGKTCCSQAIAALIGRGHWKLVVVCPAQVCEKWQREAQTVLRDFGVRVHLIGQKRKQPDGQGHLRKIGKPVLDVIRAMAEPQPSILVMSYQTAKNGPRWVHAPAQQRKVLTYTVE